MSDDSEVYADDFSGPVEGDSPEQPAAKKGTRPADYIVDGVLLFTDEDAERFLPVRMRLPKALGGGMWEGKLYEASGQQRDEYLDSLGSRVKRDKNGQPAGLTSTKGIQGLLLKHTLREDTTGKAMSEQWLAKLPAHVLQVLYDQCREMSAIGQEVEAKEGED